MIAHHLLEPAHVHYAIVYARAPGALRLPRGEEEELAAFVVQNHGALFKSDLGVQVYHTGAGRAIFWQMIRSPRIAFDGALN